MTPVDRPLLVTDRERMEHQAEEPVGVCERAKLVVGQVARVVVDRTAGSMRADHRERRLPSR